MNFREFLEFTGGDTPPARSKISFRTSNDPFKVSSPTSFSNQSITIQSAKPQGKYQGWTNWDTWAVALWITNNKIPYRALLRKSTSYIRDYSMVNAEEISEFHGEDAVEIDFDNVDWSEIRERMDEE